jgi:hypothetical protein
VLTGLWLGITGTHAEAKAFLQKKYFYFEQPDLSMPLFAFVGRITQQKVWVTSPFVSLVLDVSPLQGVHLILNIVDEMLWNHGNKLQFLVGGMASSSDTYGAACAANMRDLAGRGRFWADPSAFFTDGTATFGRVSHQFGGWEVDGYVVICV